MNDACMCLLFLALLCSLPFNREGHILHQSRAPLNPNDSDQTVRVLLNMFNKSSSLLLKPRSLKVLTLV